MHDAQDDFAGIEFNCPVCGAAFKQYVPQCPQCGADLADLYSASYQPETSRSMRVIAAVALLCIVLLLVLALVAYLLR